MRRKITNLLDLILVVQDKGVVFPAQPDCQLFPLSVKSNAFVVLMLFVIMCNFLLFGTFEQVLCHDKVISVEKDYKFTSFSPSTRRPTPDISSIA